MRRFAGVAAVVFDFDGTLAHLTIDFEEMRREILALLPAHATGATGLDRMPVLELIEAAAERVRGARADEAGFRDAARQAIERLEIEAAARGGLLPGIPAALAELSARAYGLAIVTRNCAAAVARVLDGPAGARLPHRVLLTREDVPRVKPDPGHLRAAAAALGVDPAAAVMVGDHPTDVEAGRAAGMRAVGVLSGRSRREALEAAGADLVLEDASRLPAWLPARAGGAG